MSLHKKPSSASLFAHREDVVSDEDGGPRSSVLTGPTPTTWRRERLLNIGNAHPSSSVESMGEPSAGESSALRRNESAASYGSVSTPRAGSRRASAQTIRALGRPRLPHLGSSATGMRAVSTPGTPLVHSPTATTLGFRDIRERSSLYFAGGFGPVPQRPISAYDAPLVKDIQENAESNATAVAVNGLRVWSVFLRARL
jgi:chloride channel 3/4/5